jgi:hypothetical protein
MQIDVILWRFLSIALLSTVNLAESISQFATADYQVKVLLTAHLSTVDFNLAAANFNRLSG